MSNGYDIVVIGAGPAGSSAAKAAVEKGAKTLVIEEHTEIGIPKHCPGRLEACTKTRLNEILLASMPDRVVVSEIKARRIISPKVIC